MSVLAFDTHAFVKRLTAAGMPEATAKILADEQAKLVDQRLATKADLALLATKTDVAEVKVELLKWMVFGAMGFQTIVVLGAVLALSRAAHP